MTNCDKCNHPINGIIFVINDEYHCFNCYEKHNTRMDNFNMVIIDEYMIQPTPPEIRETVNRYIHKTRAFQIMESGNKIPEKMYLIDKETLEKTIRCLNFIEWDEGNYVDDLIKKLEGKLKNET